MYLTLHTEKVFSAKYQAEINSMFYCFQRQVNGRSASLMTKTQIKTSKEELEDTKGVSRIRKSEDRQHNDQKKNDKQRSTSGNRLESDA